MRYVLAALVFGAAVGVGFNTREGMLGSAVKGASALIRHGVEALHYYD